MDTAQFGMDTARFGMDTARFGMDTAQFGMDTAQFGMDTARFGMDTAMFGMDTAQSDLTLYSLIYYGYQSTWTPCSLVRLKIFHYLISTVPVELYTNMRKENLKIFRKSVM
jgi:hypothetical protein